MSGYDFLQGTRVIEVAQLGPDSVGGFLADMGAEVIKVEGPDGDPVRFMGDLALGSPEGYGFMHLRWNRGKKSIGIDLKTDPGKRLFLQLVEQADVVIEGMRAGVLDRLGLGYDALRARNAALVFCSLSGLGSRGPYRDLAAHGPSFDAFGGLSGIQIYACPKAEREAIPWAPVGMHAMGRDAAIGILAALIRARQTGQGAMIEVTGAEAAAHWLPEGVDTHLNPDRTHTRTPALMNSRGKMVLWPRLHAYATRDGREIFFQCVYPKYWTRFCTVIERLDLLRCYDEADDVGAVDEDVYAALCEVFRTRTRDQWMAFCLAHDIPVLPVNKGRDLADDPHFLARDNIYEVDCPGAGHVRLASTAIKAAGQDFQPDIAPAPWQDTRDILGDVLGLGEADVERLRAAGAIIMDQASG